MQFKTAFAAALGASAASLVAAQGGFCPEAARFGNMQIQPSTFAPGDSFTITSNFSCSLNQYNIVPAYVDYTLNVPVNNNGHEPPVVLARRDFTGSKQNPIDTFTGTIPHGFYFADANYVVEMTLTYPIAGTDGSEVFIRGGVETPVDLQVPA